MLTALVTVETAASSVGTGAGALGLGAGAGAFGMLAVGARATAWTVGAGCVFGAGEGLAA